MILIQSLLPHCKIVFHIFVPFLFVIYIILVFSIHSAFISFQVSYDIYVSSINVFQSSLLRIYSYPHSFVNSCDLHSITGPYFINHIFISTKVNSLWSFSFWYTFRSLLNFNMLFIWENASIMLDFKSVRAITHLTFCWLYYAALFKLSTDFLVALLAHKSSLLHFRDNVRAANNYTSNCDKLFNEIGVHFSDAVNLSQVVWLDLNDSIWLLLIVLILHVDICIWTSHTYHSVQIAFLVTLGNDQVKDWNDVSWVVFKLAIKHLVELVQMVTIYFESVFFEFLKLLEFF